MAADAIIPILKTSKVNMPTTRREFLRKTSTTALTGAVSYHLATTSTAAEASSPSELPGLGLIGAGRMGHNHMRFAKGMCNVVAVCDVDTNRREKAKRNLSDGKARAVNDYREVLDMQDVDVVYIATPDHWHAKILIEAMRAGKDVYCEKPLTLTVDEGKQIRKVEKQTSRIVQVGTMQRSFLDLFVKAVAIAGEGRLGRIHRITAAIGGTRGSGLIPAVDPPDWLDWNQWLGPAPEAPFRLIPAAEDNTDEWVIGETNAHNRFRYWLDYSGGTFTDWGAHHVDIACWALRAAGQSDTLDTVGGDAQFPVPYKDGYPTQTDRYHTATSFSMSAKMADGAEVLINSHGRNGVLIEGEKGRIFVNRGALQGQPAEELAENPLPDDAISKTYKGLPTPYNQHRNHWSNFFHCIRERVEPISDVTSHLRALDICHLAHIAARCQRPVKWDADNEQIVGDDQANALLAREYRKGFEIEG